MFMLGRSRTVRRVGSRQSRDWLDCFFTGSDATGRGDGRGAIVDRRRRRAADATKNAGGGMYVQSRARICARVRRPPEPRGRLGTRDERKQRDRLAIPIQTARFNKPSFSRVTSDTIDRLVLTVAAVVCATTDRGRTRATRRSLEALNARGDVAEVALLRGQRRRQRRAPLRVRSSSAPRPSSRRAYPRPPSSRGRSPRWPTSSATGPGWTRSGRSSIARRSTPFGQSPTNPPSPASSQSSPSESSAIVVVVVG